MTRNVKHFLEIKKETSSPLESRLYGENPFLNIYTT